MRSIIYLSVAPLPGQGYATAALCPKALTFLCSITHHLLPGLLSRCGAGVSFPIILCGFPSFTPMFESLVHVSFSPIPTPLSQLLEYTTFLIF